MTRAFNMDFMEALKQFPDKYFDLAVVDPPYGDGIDTSGEAADTHTHRGSVEPLRGVLRPLQDGTITFTAVAARERERERTRSAEVTLSAACGRGTVSRTGGTWAEKFGKKSLSGTPPRSKNTLMNCSVSHATR